MMISGYFNFLKDTCNILYPIGRQMTRRLLTTRAKIRFLLFSSIFFFDAAELFLLDGGGGSTGEKVMDR